MSFYLKLLLGTLLAGTTTLSSAKSQAATQPANSREEFCRNRQEPTYFQDLLLDSKNLMGFRNRGGIGGGGVCWWHSRFLRNATYLTIFRPDLPRPTSDEAENIISTLRDGSGVVEIPGYANFSEFSRDYESWIQPVLDNWQLSHGAMFGWLQGLSGDAEVSPEELQETMDQTYRWVKDYNRIVYHRLQIPGITSHAWLVTAMEMTADGYVMTVVDSNYSQAYNVQYKYGMTQLREYRGIVPYAASKYESEVRDLIERGQEYCQ